MANANINLKQIEEAYRVLDRVSEVISQYRKLNKHKKEKNSEKMREISEELNILSNKFYLLIPYEE